MARFTFVDVLPNNAPARSKEVRNSEIRAHAARVGHLRHAKKLTRSRTKASAESVKLQLPTEEARHTLDRKNSQDSDSGWQSNTSSSGEDDEIVQIQRFTNTQAGPGKYGVQTTEPIYFVQLQPELDKITKMCRFWNVHGRRLLTIHSLASLRAIFYAILQCFEGKEHYVAGLA